LENQPNGTYALDKHNQRIYNEFAQPAHVEYLMTEVLKTINSLINAEISVDEAPRIYAKIHVGLVDIHPFGDGNGRLARLIANLPLLNAGLPPIMISQQDRREYISLLSDYDTAIGQINVNTGVWPDEALLTDFNRFCAASYALTQQIIHEAVNIQQTRNVRVASSLS